MALGGHGGNNKLRSAEIYGQGSDLLLLRLDMDDLIMKKLTTFNTGTNQWDPLPGMKNDIKDVCSTDAFLTFIDFADSVDFVDFADFSHFVDFADSTNSADSVDSADADLSIM